MSTFVSTAALVKAFESAHALTFSAYVVPGNGVLDALQTACRRGASVRVRLEAAPFRDAYGARRNAAVVARLAALGADARLVSGLHLKGAVVDGRAFLDDRNWNARGDTIVYDDDAADARVVSDAILGRGDRSSPALATSKTEALKREEHVLDCGRPGEDVIVETESFGCGKQIFPVLERLARSGCRVRLLVNANELAHSRREENALAHLRQLGIAVRACSAGEKFAVCGEQGWISSANATYAEPSQRGWGLRTDQPQIVEHLRAAFEARWPQAVIPRRVSSAAPLTRKTTSGPFHRSLR